MTREHGWLVGNNESLATLAALITFPMIAGNIMSLLDKITSEVCWKDRDQKGGGLVGELGDDVGLPDDVELLPVHLQLVAPPLWHQDAVTNGHTHWDCFAWDDCQLGILGETKSDSFQF